MTNIHRRYRIVLVAAMVCANALSCGSTVDVVLPGQGGTGMAGGAGGHGTGGNGATGGTGGVGAGNGGSSALPPECLSPQGVQVCGGPHQCPEKDPGCGICYLTEEMMKAGDIGMCINDALANWHDCYACEDGEICGYPLASDPMPNCVPWDLGVLFEKGGATNRLRYADLSLWTGDPLPEPDACPVLPNVPLCGANCGGCAVDEVCTGRSPLHPHGICVARDLDKLPCNTTTMKCQPDSGCFVFAIQLEAQALADEHGYCLPKDACVASAALLPGGGKCVLP